MPKIKLNNNFTEAATRVTGGGSMREMFMNFRSQGKTPILSAKHNKYSKNREKLNSSSKKKKKGGAYVSIKSSATTNNFSGIITTLKSKRVINKNNPLLRKLKSVQ